MSTTLLVGSLLSSTTTAQSVVSTFVNNQGITMFCIQSESEGTGVNSESEGTGLLSASESEGTGIYSESEGTGLYSESEGTGVNAVNCYPFD